MLQIEVSKGWKIVEFQKDLIKMKNCKTFYEARTARRPKGICVRDITKEIIQPFPDSLLIFGIKIFLRRNAEIHKYLLSKSFKNTVLGRQEMLQCKCFFWHQTETCFLENLQSHFQCSNHFKFSMSIEFRFAK